MESWKHVKQGTRVDSVDELKNFAGVLDIALCMSHMPKNELQAVISKFYMTMIFQNVLVNHPDTYNIEMGNAFAFHRDAIVKKGIKIALEDAWRSFVETASGDLEIFAKKIESEMVSVAFAERQRGASRVRYENDPKQRAKAEIRSLWELWCKDPSRYASKAAFARDMLEKFEELKSQKKIEDWVRAWERE